MTRREILIAYKEGRLSAAEVRQKLTAQRQQSFKCPLSEGQKGLWILYKMSPGMSAYNVPVCFRISGALEMENFKRALAIVMVQQPVLSSLIREEGGIPYQAFDASMSPAFYQEDISALEAAEIPAFINKKVKEPFDLESGPLIRMHVFSRSAREHIVLITVHHIIFDGSSILPLTTTLLDAYGNLMQGRSPEAAPLPAGYGDFVRWEREMLSGTEGEEHLRYWKNQLSGLPALDLPADRPRPSTQSFRGRVLTAHLPAGLSEQIKSLARSQHVTLSAVFLGLFKLLLHRYTGQEDIIVGMPSIIRPQERFVPVIGYFINMIPVRSRQVGKQSFSGFLQELQLTLADGLDHASYPFPAIVRELNVPRSQAHQPVFQTVFAYQNFFQPADLRNFNDMFQHWLPMELVEGVHQEGEYEFGLEVFERQDGFSLNMKYSPDLFESDTIAGMMRHYITLANEVVNDPSLLPGEYSLLSQEEQKKVLIEWNSTGAEYPAEKCVHELFEGQARKTPEAVAAVYEEEILTYRELDEKSSCLAKYLQKQGIGPDRPVGICVEKSLDLLVGVFGIFKAGGAYVPLDPDYPSDRLEYMLGDSKVSLVLTQSRLKERVAGLNGAGAGTVFLDGDWELIEGAAKEQIDLKREVQPGHLAYVIYTSGSTGRPKGVMIPHRGLTNLLFSMSKEPGLNARDIMLSLAPYSFDMVMPELYLPLIHGARCCICSTEKTKDPEKLLGEIKRHKPTIMQATPVTCKMLFHAGWKNEEKIKILCGGEALTETLKEIFMENNCDLWNMYGPTETTVWSAIKHISKNDPVTVGRPIANTQIYILDKYLRPTPVRVPGELCIAGDGLARGYLNLPRYTMEKFIDNPFNPGTKLYKTGDLARWLPNGEIVFLGRNDDQVKVRGFRIELGEIESQLRLHPLIQDCAVVVKGQEGNKQLVAYFVAGEQAPVDTQQLRGHLRSGLPDYMIPAFLVQLDRLPLTPSGKINRQELAGRQMEITRAEKAGIPQSETEQEVLDIWKDVLGVNNIGTDDNFFEVGGNSLLAVAVAQRIKNKFAIPFNVTSLFEFANIREISEHINCVFQVGQPQREFTEHAANEQEGGVVNKEPLRDEFPGYYQDSIAVIGISCRFPGAGDHYHFWRNIREGKESITFFPEEEFRKFDLPAEIKNNPRYVSIQSTIEGKELFDPHFFNISEQDAQLMDPQFRHLLMHSWKALDDAGYVAGKIPDTSVFMSTGNNFYQAFLPKFTTNRTNVMDDPEKYSAWVWAQNGSIPTMISNKLGLKGPSFYVHSNCSSSLVGLYLACQSLKAGESRQALVGAAALYPTKNVGYIYQEELKFSSDGHCKAFDASADGMVGGEGVAVVLLKKALDAIKDGDHIYALLRGISVNNDGPDRAAFFAPSVKGQAGVIRKALEITGVNPETIGYVEADGAGTRWGDPIEVKALGNAYSNYTTKKQFCGLGSVKTNIGHLAAAAGLAGCVKVALSLYNKEIPPSINYKKPSPEIDLVNSPFYVVEKLQGFAGHGAPRRAALSAFGFGGTNGHAIFEEFPGGRTARSAGNAPRLVALSARNKEQLIAYGRLLLECITARNLEDGQLSDLAYTLLVGRVAMESRAAFIAGSMKELTQKLECFIEGKDYISDFFYGETTELKTSIRLLEEDEDHRELLDKWIAKGKVKKLAELWVKGFNINWETLFVDFRPRRMSLPGYPFGLKRYWFQDSDIEAPAAGKGLLIQ